MKFLQPVILFVYACDLVSGELSTWTILDGSTKASLCGNNYECSVKKGQSIIINPTWVFAGTSAVNPRLIINDLSHVLYSGTSNFYNMCKSGNGVALITSNCSFTLNGGSHNLRVGPFNVPMGSGGKSGLIAITASSKLDGHDTSTQFPSQTVHVTN